MRGEHKYMNPLQISYRDSLTQNSINVTKKIKLNNTKHIIIIIKCHLLWSSCAGQLTFSHRSATDMYSVHPLKSAQKRFAQNCIDPPPQICTVDKYTRCPKLHKREMQKYTYCTKLHRSATDMYNVHSPAAQNCTNNKQKQKIYKNAPTEIYTYIAQISHRSTR